LAPLPVRERAAESSLQRPRTTWLSLRCASASALLLNVLVPRRAMLTPVASSPSSGQRQPEHTLGVLRATHSQGATTVNALRTAIGITWNPGSSHFNHECLARRHLGLHVYSREMPAAVGGPCAHLELRPRGRQGPRHTRSRQGAGIGGSNGLRGSRRARPRTGVQACWQSPGRGRYRECLRPGPGQSCHRCPTHRHGAPQVRLFHPRRRR
jgi:hypothetical protein